MCRQRWGHLGILIFVAPTEDHLPFFSNGRFSDAMTAHSYAALARLLAPI